MARFALIVEDDADLRPEMVEYLGRRGCCATGCGSLAEARQALGEALTNAAAPQYIICDIGLPDGDGLRLVEEFGALLPTTKWLLMSGNHDFERLDRELQSLPNLHQLLVIEKPFSLRVLQQFVDDNSSSSIAY
jgi:DNA-binding NtrC family response regulator